MCVFVFGFTLVALSAWAIADQQSPSPVLLVVLGVFAVLATHRETFFGDETAMSGSIVVVVAAVVAFRDDAWLLGPVLCCVAAGLHWAHVSHGAWSKVIVNSAATAIAASAAAILFRAVGGSGSLALLGLGTLFAVFAYWFLNNLAIGTVLSTMTPGPAWRHIVELLRSETEMLGFALAGALCGLLFIEVGVWAGALSLVLVLGAVDVLVISRPGPSSERTDHRGLAAALARTVSLAAGAAVSFALAEALHPLVGLVAGIATAIVVMTALTTVMLQRRLGAWDLRLAGGVALADAPYAAVAAIAGVVTALTDPAIGVAVASVGLVGVGGLLALRRHRVIAEPEVDDTQLLAMLELARAERRSAPRG